MKKEFDLISKDYDLGFAKLYYRGWIIFFLVCCFLWAMTLFQSSSIIVAGVSYNLKYASFFGLPFLVALLLKNGIWERNNKTYYCAYSGSWNWLLFWAFVLPLIAIILFFVKKPKWVCESKNQDELSNKKDKKLINKNR